MKFEERELPTLPVKLFKRGMTVYYQGRPWIVSHVILRRGALLVKLSGEFDPVDADDLECTITYVNFNRGNTY